MHQTASRTKDHSHAQIGGFSPIAEDGGNGAHALLTRLEAASYLRIQPQTLANWAVSRTQRLPYVKVGRRVMYRLSDLAAFVMANRHGNEAVMGGANG